MKAIGYEKTGAVTGEGALTAFELPAPEPGPRDLLVEVRGVSVNPVDAKLRSNRQPEQGHGILGFDAAGVVKAVGSDVTLFSVGDEVFYAGDVTRPGTNAEFHCVDERIVGRKPKSLDFPEAAGMPLTSITAWEMLFDCFRVPENGGDGDALLVIGGAGGVGSILIQLARKLTNLTVIATASRAETRDWVLEMGAHHVINHRNPLDNEIKELGVAPRYVAALTATDQHFKAIVDLILPRGIISLIDDPATLDVLPLKPKSLTVSWEFMFARSMFQTADMQVQHALLNRVATMLDDGTLRSTVSEHFGAMSVDRLTKAHVHQETGTAIGKTVLSGLD
ncbi:MAG: zinc-binding alcohol dehydrogenase family protein [Woeseiaceae bacterium]